VRHLLFTLLAVLAACASPGSLDKGGKGGLVSVKVDESALSHAYAPRRLALLVGVSQFQGKRSADHTFRMREEPFRVAFQEV
jgi:hypothetical protein